jgi:CHAP domain
MTEWYEKPYPGGPMVKVKGFPRPLYPPDAAEHGKIPSSPGPDCEAYKRTVSRAGRWPWQTFDGAFSNGFSHGTSGDVGKTGVAGIQRQQNVEATGWIGEKTFNTLRSIKIPEGLPHAGEMAMDATAVNLIAQAFEKFQGSESTGTDTHRHAALQKAISQLGITESPANSNNTKYGQWYGVNYQPWCAIFVTWCQLMVGDHPAFVKGSRYAYCPYVVADAQAHRYGLSVTDDPIPGDIVVYNWSWSGEYDHIGIFEKWVDGRSSFNAIEGNTSYSDNSNGGEVMRRTRSVSGQGTCFVRAAEPL